MCTRVCVCVYVGVCVCVFSESVFSESVFSESLFSESVRSNLRAAPARVYISAECDAHPQLYHDNSYRSMSKRIKVVSTSDY